MCVLNSEVYFLEHYYNRCLKLLFNNPHRYSNNVMEKLFSKEIKVPYEFYIATVTTKFKTHLHNNYVFDIPATKKQNRL